MAKINMLAVINYQYEHINTSSFDHNKVY